MILEDWRISPVPIPPMPSSISNKFSSCDNQSWQSCCTILIFCSFLNPFVRMIRWYSSILVVCSTSSFFWWNLLSSLSGATIDVPHPSLGQVKLGILWTRSMGTGIWMGQACELTACPLSVFFRIQLLSQSLPSLHALNAILCAILFYILNPYQHSAKSLMHLYRWSWHMYSFSRGWCVKNRCAQ